MKIDEVSLEHCTLSYDLMELWKQWPFKGDLALGVIDQRSDPIETPQLIGGAADARARLFFSGSPPAYERVRFRTCAARYHPQQTSRPAATCRERRKL